MIIFILEYFDYEHDEWRTSKISNSKELLENVAAERGWGKGDFFIHQSFCTMVEDK